MRRELRRRILGGIGAAAFAIAALGLASLLLRDPGERPNERIWDMLMDAGLLPPLTPEQAAGYLALAAREPPSGVVRGFLDGLRDEMLRAEPLYPVALSRLRDLPLCRNGSCAGGRFLYDLRRALDGGREDAVRDLVRSPRAGSLVAGWDAGPHGRVAAAVRAGGPLSVDELLDWRRVVTRPRLPEATR